MHDTELGHDITLATALAHELPCQHDAIWVGFVDGNALPMDCSRCTPREDAEDELLLFSLVIRSGSPGSRSDSLGQPPRSGDEPA